MVSNLLPLSGIYIGFKRNYRVLDIPHKQLRLVRNTQTVATLGFCMCLRGDNYYVANETNLLHDGWQAKTEAQGITVLHLASNRGLLRLTTALVEGGADLNCKDKEGNTPLMAALVGG